MWILWFVQLFVMQIILLNFLIAVISQTYEDVVSSQLNYTYKDKAEMNEECQLILSTLWYKGEVKMIVFTYDKNIFTSESGEWGGIVDSIKGIVEKSNVTTKTRIDKFQKNIDLSLEGVLKSQNQMRETIKDIANLQNKAIASAGGQAGEGAASSVTSNTEALIKNTRD